MSKRRLWAVSEQQLKALLGTTAFLVLILYLGLTYGLHSALKAGATFYCGIIPAVAAVRGIRILRTSSESPNYRGLTISFYLICTILAIVLAILYLSGPLVRGAFLLNVIIILPTLLSSIEHRLRHR